MRIRIYLWVWVLIAVTLSPQNSFAEKVALTFDDLPLNGELPPGVTEVDITKSVLAILKDRHAPQVFGFINAAKLENNPRGQEALQLWVAAGQRVGNHTYSHIDLTTNTAQAFDTDVEKNEPQLQLLSPQSDWRWLRYPYLHEGETLEKRHAVREYLATHRYAIAQVTLDYEDYLWNSPYARCFAKHDVASIRRLRTTYLAIAAEYLDLDRKLAQLTVGRPVDHVLLLHLGAFSETILPAVLDLLRTKGFTLATLEQVHADPIYRLDPDIGLKWGGSLLEQEMERRQLPFPAVSKKPSHELDALCR